MDRASRFALYAWLTLAYTALVGVWGAYVRATGSGAGCGNHWPLCNGEVLPRSPTMTTVIELSHRLTSGLLGILVLILVAWAVRRFGWRHRISRSALASLGLTIVEALLGAALVRFDLVVDNASGARGFVVGAHLVNTLLLLGAYTLTAAWASGERKESPWGPLRLRGQGATGWLVGVGVAALCLLGASGAVTALGDTLYPVSEMTEQALAELPPAGTVLVRLRVLHPFLAVAVGIYLIVAAALIRLLRPHPRMAGLGLTMAALFTAELGLGMLNIALAAPVWLQLVHLAAAYAVWVSWILVGLAGLSSRAPRGALGAASPTVSAQG